ncbi:MAG: DUF2993 domain-containing protein [Cyanobacteria bacterium P01_E01_bin.45]
MEILAGLLALLAGLTGGAGFAVDRVARNELLAHLDEADVLEVRVQSAPNLKLVAGRVDRVLLAGRGLEIEPYPRIELLELETDPVNVGFDDGALVLESPLRAALRFSITEDDLNASLQSPGVLEQFQNIEANLPVLGDRDGTEVFDLENPMVELLGGDRLRLQARLVLQDESENPEEEQALDIDLVTSIVLEDGQRLLLVAPEMSLNDQPLPPEIADAFAGGISRALDVSGLEDRDIFVRLLDLEISDDALSAVGILRLESLDFG